MVDYPIDLVYLWCDGSDPEFKKRKRVLLGDKPCEDDDKERYEQIDELKYSLRSVYAYVPWVNHIYIVTDRQVPSWLNTDHPKITVVDHSEILPQKVIPNFNSCAIETALHNIPNLSEHFLYANDDMFFYRSLEPSFFFTKEKLPILRLKRIKEENNDYYTTIANACNLVYAKTGKNYKYLSLHHNVDSYLKSELELCFKTFEKELRETQASQFRNAQNIQRVLFSFFMLSRKKGSGKIVNRTFWEKICSKIYHASLDSFVLSQRLSNKEKLKRMKRFNPALFCLNDSGGISDEQRTSGKKFLKEIFSKKCPFEKSL